MEIPTTSRPGLFRTMIAVCLASVIVVFCLLALYCFHVLQKKNRAQKQSSHALGLAVIHAP